MRPAAFLTTAGLLGSLAAATLTMAAPAAAAELGYRPGASRAGPPSRVRITYGVPRRYWHVPQQVYFVDQGPSYDYPGTPYLEPSAAYPDDTAYPYGRSNPYDYGYGLYGGYGHYGFRGRYGVGRHGDRSGHPGWRGRHGAGPMRAAMHPGHGARPRAMRLDGGPRGMAPRAAPRGPR